MNGRAVAAIIGVITLVLGGQSASPTRARDWSGSASHR